MLRAVFVRTLKPGVTYEQFKDAWVPEGLSGSYPAKARVARNVANDRNSQFPRSGLIGTLLRVRN